LNFPVAADTIEKSSLTRCKKQIKQRANRCNVPQKYGRRKGRVRNKPGSRCLTRAVIRSYSIARHGEVECERSLGQPNIQFSKKNQNHGYKIDFLDNEASHSYMVHILCTGLFDMGFEIKNIAHC